MEEAQPQASRLLRYTKKLPGYRRARRRVQRSLRTNVLARRVVRRIASLGGLPVSTHPRQTDTRGLAYPPVGRLLQGRARAPLPTLIVSLVDVPEERLPEVVREVASWQVLTAGFRPVFLLGTPVLAVVRAYGYGVEIVPDAASWGLSHEESAERLHSRVGSMTEIYRASGLLEVGSEGLSAMQVAFLSHLPVPVPGPPA